MAGVSGRGQSTSLPPVPERAPGQGVTDWVFEHVKRDVIQGRLRPESVLVEGALADRFGVSRGPAREALHRLRRSGLVRAVPRVGYIVSSISLRDYDEVFQMRVVLEPLATSLATERMAAGKVTSARLEESIAAIDDLFAVDQDARPARLAEVNHEFHLELARMSGNHRLERTIDGLLDELQRVMHLLAGSGEVLDDMRDDHPVLLREMKKGDPEAAGELMRSQLTHAQQMMRGLAIGSELRIDGIA